MSYLREPNGIIFISLINSNSSKFLRLFQTYNKNKTNYCFINCYAVSKYQNLLVLGIIQLTRYKLSTLQFWKFDYQWEMVQELIFDYPQNSEIENICFNQQETQLACKFGQLKDIIVIYQQNQINRQWFVKQIFQMERIMQYYLINDNIFVISEMIPAGCLGLSRKYVLRSYVLQNKNYQLEIKTHFDEYITPLYYFERKSLLVGQNSKHLIFLKISDNGEMYVQQRLQFSEQFQSVEISQDLKYLVLFYNKEKMKIFRLFQK